MQLNKYKNQNVAVFGLGKTSLSVINALIKNGARIYAWDDHEEQIINAKMMYKECNFIHPKEYNWHEISTLVLSPGVPTSYPKPHWVVKLAGRFDCKIKSDIELFLEAKTANQKVVGVTGTNGKSTTTSLIGHILGYAGKKVAIGGNLGVPVLDLNADTEIYVIEFSSFQLELMNMPAVISACDHTFFSGSQCRSTGMTKIDISVLLNITPDHIDRHGSMENYVAIKSRLINSSKVAVIGCDNEITARIFNNFTGNKIPISASMSFQRVTLESRKEKPLPITQMTEGGARDLISLAGNNSLDYSEQITGMDRNYLDPSVSYLDDKRGAGIQEIQLELENHVSNTKINLISNAENIAAAYAVCKLLGVDSSTIINGIKSFSGLRHRNELLGKIKNVLFVNDSKATNAESSEKAILSYKNIYWIVGGKSKEGGIESLSKHFTRIRKAFLIGESAEAFASTLKNKVDFVECGNLKNAFKLAYREAFNSKEEITILLSPACASFDQWKNFEERGGTFCKMFENLRDSFIITDAI
ncbi:MAG: UDP-N-acetylmuramoylalanine--D-glutamate ligase [Rickettsiales bacterium]|jgi:UDP-N-acetylmuramoylalanine--D-glutamate ligase|nr:UDP-N-acetylmuramoylalanine--D-glutamate ligase [Rickettsiales bacterium]